MQHVNPTILRTPLEIYDATKLYFDSANMKLNLQGSKISLILKLPGVEDVTVNSAIDAKGFTKAIADIQGGAQIAKHVATNPLTIPLDVSRFSLEAPLKDWQKYMRVMYERQNLNCVDLIIDYLQGQVEEARLKDLGLAPSQVEGNYTDGDRPYFEEVLDRIGKMKSEPKKRTLEAFEEKYPTIARLGLKDLCQKVHQVGIDDENDFITKTRTILKEHVVGQDQAVEIMATTLARQRNAPEISRVFLFVGPSGVGKTELAKAVSKIKSDRFMTFAMNQYQSEFDCTKLFGSSSGFVGSTDKPHFAKEVERFNPTPITTTGSKKTYEISNLVILFDEFEKAHSKVKQSFLLLFDEKYCEVSYTEKSENVAIRYEFKSCVFVNTSNLYQTEICNAFKDSKKVEEIVEIFKKLNIDHPNGNSCSPELLNRNTIVPFGPIPSGESYQRLLKLKFKSFCSKLKAELKCQDVKLEEEEHVIAWLEKKLYGEGTDIRRLESYFDKITQLIYQNQSKLGRLEQRQIIFSYTDQTPYITFATYLESLERYYPDFEIPKLFFS